MSTIFTKIADGQIPSYRVASNDNYYAFLDINPLTPGHTLVIPRVEKDYIFDLDDDTYQGLWKFAAHVAEAIKRAIPCKRVAVVVLGLEVPHTHIHLIPINSEADVDFRREKLSLPEAEMQAIAKAIADEFDKE